MQLVIFGVSVRGSKHSADTRQATRIDGQNVLEGCTVNSNIYAL